MYLDRCAVVIASQNVETSKRRNVKKIEAFLQNL